jgi:putative transposase
MQNSTTIPFPHPQLTAVDPLTEVLRQGAQRLLAQAIEAEIAVLLAQYANRHDPQGRQAVVRNGYLPERDVQTGIGAVRVKVPRVRDRAIQFSERVCKSSLKRVKGFCSTWGFA